MITSIYEVLDSLRASALDKRDKGDKFERLIKAFLETDPEWSQRFSEVEFFAKWDRRGNVPDIGIDLVAKNRFDDGFSAIQCKFYDDGQKVSKADIDKAFSQSRIGPITSSRIATSSIPPMGGVETLSIR